jgi:hypothetical protein
MHRHRLFFVIILLTPQLSFAQSSPTSNKALFEDCKVYERVKPNLHNASPSELLAATSCIYYMAGAFQIYNAKAGKRCDFSQRTVESFIADYLAYTRKNGNLAAASWVVVLFVLDDCYCGVDPDFAKAFCPTPKTSTTISGH